MKKYIIIIFGLFTTLWSYSQEYYPFPDSNAIWNSKYGGYYGTHIERFGLNGDTVINNQIYNKVYQIVDDSTLNIDNMTYYAAIRENASKQIFAKMADYDNEILIYDFSLNIGDTIISNSPSGYLNYGLCIITNIDSIELENNQFRKRFKINAEQDYWIEGIGSIGGLFHPITDYIIGSYCDLTCFKYNDTAIYVNNPECNKCFCSLLTPILEKEENHNFINVYPNPAKTNINIDFELKNGLAIIRLINSNGDLIENRITKTFPIRINIKDIPYGMYLIQLNTDKEIFTKTIIKIE